MNYTTNEVAQKLGITKDTLFYYEREGLLPQIERDEMNRRIYSESDIEWIFLIRFLRDTDMPMCKIKQYISLLKHGGENSIPERKNMLVEHEAFIIGKIKAYQDLLLLIKKKIEFYRLPEHGLFRRGGLRHPDRRQDLFRQGRQRTERGGERRHRRHHQQPIPL